jgi:MSHA biogenesis protein MshE
MPGKKNRKAGAPEIDFEKERLGVILIRRGLLQEARLKLALALQRRGDERLLGEILVDKNFCQEIDVVVALIQQWGFPYLDPGRYPPAPDVVALVPPDLARSADLAPVDRVGGVLSVVMANPLDRAALSDLSRRTGCRTAAFIATGTAVRAALDRDYPGA